MQESWKDIPGYEGLYQASDHGRIKSYDKTVRTGKCHTRVYKGRVKALRFDSQKRYLLIDLSKSDNVKTILVHRLVAMTFIGSCEGLEINHKNGDKVNNAVTNLELVTRGQNEIHKYRELHLPHPFTGRKGAFHSRSIPVLKIDAARNIVIKEYESARLAETDGFHSANISLCCNGKQKYHKGFIWKFKL